MSGTRSPFQRAPATDAPAAVIVAHGAPSAPEGQEAAIRALARQVSSHLPGWQVRGTTLAASGALAESLEGLAAPLIYPFFMSEGWFVSTALPDRLAQAGRSHCRILPPFGPDPAVRDLCLSAATAAAHQAGYRLNRTRLVIAAHGSPSDPRAAASVEAAAAFIRARGAFRRVCTGYVDQPPGVEDAARTPEPAICLPFFATAAGHVLRDIPDALDRAGFVGLRLDAIGTMPGVSAIVASALGRCAHRRAA